MPSIDELFKGRHAFATIGSRTFRRSVSPGATARVPSAAIKTMRPLNPGVRFCVFVARTKPSGSARSSLVI